MAPPPPLQPQRQPLQPQDLTDDTFFSQQSLPAASLSSSTLPREWEALAQSLYTPTPGAAPAASQ